MQSNEQTGGTAGSVTHPADSEWMDFLYEEIAPSRKVELQRHLLECRECAGRVGTWKAGMAALDTFRLEKTATIPVARWQPVLRWATAAAVVLALGFFLGRTTGGSYRQLRELQAAVAKLSDAAQSGASLDKEKVAAIANQAAGEETVRILNEYTRALENQRVQDRRSTALAINSLENRVAGLRTELETVAVNTQDGLQETHEGLAQLALLTRTGAGAQPDKTTLNPGN